MSVLPSLGALAQRLAPSYDNYPRGRTVQIFLLRTTRSETLFRTEGTGEPMCRELLVDPAGGEATDRVVITKRKQVAVERRTGREILRRYNLLFPRKDQTEHLCSLNTNDPCERCVDCWLYGFAAGKGGAQKSRVWTEDAYSVLPAGEIVDTRTFNATFENGTMRNPETQDASQALGESEYVRPGAHFLDVEVLRDVTEPELAYVLGNILRSTRYGATASRVGRVDNTLLAVAFADQELGSGLDWTLRAGRLLKAAHHPLADTSALQVARETLRVAASRAIGRVDWVEGAALDALVADVGRAWDDPEPWLRALTDSFPKPEPAKKKSAKGGKAGAES